MASSTLAQGVLRKVKRVASVDISSDELQESLLALSRVESQQGSGVNRSTLKANMELSLLQCSNKFSTDWESCVADLGSCESHLLHMLQTCNEVKSLVSDRNTTPSALLSRTESLLQELSVTSRKESVVLRFVQDYQLDKADADIIASGDIDEAFFSALQRVHRVHENCRSLLHTHHQRAGLELLDSMASYEETAYERLCKWVQSQCLCLTDVDVAEVHPLLSSALQALKARPVLLRYCAEEVATARHAAVFKAFLMALTQGGWQGAPRPIEVHAHSPRRYVGDMLAWIHQAVASEKELLLSLLFHPDSMQAEHDVVVVEGVSVYLLLDKILEGVCQPLQLRIEQVLMGSPETLVQFQLYQLLAFYHTTVQNLMKVEESALLSNIAKMRDASHSGFKQQVRNWTEKLRRTALTMPKDLSFPAAAAEVMAQVLDIVKAFESDLSTGVQEEKPQSSFVNFLNDSLHPLLQVCQQMAKPTAVDEMSPNTAETHSNDSEIFFLNCLLAVWSPLSLHESCTSFVATLRREIDKQVQNLAQKEAALLAAQSGMPENMVKVVLDAASDASGGEQCPENLSYLLQSMFVAFSGADAIPDYERISIPRFRMAVSQAVCQCVVKCYQHAHEALAQASSDMLRDVKSPDQIATLLGVTS